MEFYKCQAFVGVQSLLACQRINALLTESQVSMTQAIKQNSTYRLYVFRVQSSSKLVAVLDDFLLKAFTGNLIAL